MTELLDVLGNDPSDILVRVVAFVFPVAVFFTLLVLLRVKARRQSGMRNSSAHSGEIVTSERAAAQSQESSSKPTISVATETVAGRQAEMAGSTQTSQIQMDAQHAPAPRSVPPQAAAATVEKSAPAAAPSAPSAPVDLASIKARFEEALTTAPETALAPLYLEYASQCRKAGDERTCVEALRSAAGYGALHGPRVAHAAARIELAEIAYNSGDAIGACEQWQIARLVLHEEGLKEPYARIDKRMRDNGCPTDWVLTDF